MKPCLLILMTCSLAAQDRLLIEAGRLSMPNATSRWAAFESADARNWSFLREADPGQAIRIHPHGSITFYTAVIGTQSWSQSSFHSGPSQPASSGPEPSIYFTSYSSSFYYAQYLASGTNLWQSDVATWSGGDSAQYVFSESANHDICETNEGSITFTYHAPSWTRQIAGCDNTCNWNLARNVGATFTMSRTTANITTTNSYEPFVYQPMTQDVSSVSIACGLGMNIGGIAGKPYTVELGARAIRFIREEYTKEFVPADPPFAAPRFLLLGGVIPHWTDGEWACYRWNMTGQACINVTPSIPEGDYYYWEYFCRRYE